MSIGRCKYLLITIGVPGIKYYWIGRYIKQLMRFFVFVPIINGLIEVSTITTNLTYVKSKIFLSTTRAYV